MNKRWDVPETSVSIQRLSGRTGEPEDAQDCVAGIEVLERGMIRLDLRNLRPVRVLDRDNLLIDIYTHDILTALADKVKAAVTE